MERAQRSLREGEVLFAFLDDVCTVSMPDRVCDIHRLLEESLWAESGIRVHEGKTHLWNAIGESPPGHERLQRTAVLADPAAVVWRGSEDLPSHRCGIKVLGTPLGHQDFVRVQLEMLSAHHHTLLAHIPMVEDVQSAWLLLVHCASARRTMWLEWSSPRWQPRFVRDMTPGCGSVCAEFSTYLQRKGTTWSELLPCLLFWEALGCDLLVVGAPQRSGRVGQTHCR